jgi:hypothetical protein
MKMNVAITPRFPYKVSMRSLLVAIFSTVIALVSFGQGAQSRPAASPVPIGIPAELVGIWATDGSVFRGEALTKGQALYLDVDGVGASISGNGSDVLGARFVVTAYDAATHTLNIAVTERGKVLFNGTLIFDPIQKTIVSTKGQNVPYRKRTDGFSPRLRSSLGLEPRGIGA